MKNLREEMIKKIGPIADKFGEMMKFKQSKIKSGGTFVEARYPADYECRRKVYSAAASGLTIQDWLDLRSGIKSSGGTTNYSNTATWILNSQPTH
jgi:hypothetical protein